MVERDFVSVDDVAEAFLAVARQPHRLREPGAIYNVGSGRGVKIKDLVRLIRDRFGIAAQPEWGSMPNRDWDTETWIADPARIRADFDWEAQTDLETGVERFTEWFGENEAIRAFYEERLAARSRG